MFVYKLSEIGFLADLKGLSSDTLVPETVLFEDEDDLDLCLYYLQTLSNVLKACGDVAWAVLASKHISTNGQLMHISSKSLHSNNRASIKTYQVEVKKAR